MAAFYFQKQLTSSAKPFCKKVITWPCSNVPRKQLAIALFISRTISRTIEIYEYSVAPLDNNGRELSVCHTVIALPV